jgi:hypothetical protein
MLRERLLGIGPTTPLNKQKPIFKISATTMTGEVPHMVSGEFRVLGSLQRGDCFLRRPQLRLCFKPEG